VARRRKRPARRSYTFVCRACRISLHDGVDYTWCPRCSGEVDWVDPRYHVWLCPPCDLIVNQRAMADKACPNCSGVLAHLSGPLPSSEIPGSRARIALAQRAGIALLVVQAVFALLDPDGFPYLGPLLVFAQLGGVVAIAALLAGSRELRSLVGYHGTRIIHGIEHATANVLEERGLEVENGQTTDGMFVLDIQHDGRQYEQLESTVGDAAADAISRLRFGDRKLAYDAGCSTSRLLALALLAFAIIAAGVVALVLGMPAGLAYALTIGAALVVWAIRQHAGIAAQRWLTVSTDFTSAIVTRVDKRISADGRTLTAIVMIDVIPRAIDIDAIAPVPL
jgi:hypothetical protein